MEVTGDKGEDEGETRGKNHGEQEQLRAVKAASWHPNCEFPARDESTEQLRAGPSPAPGRPPSREPRPFLPGRSPAAASARAR